MKKEKLSDKTTADEMSAAPAESTAELVNEPQKEKSAKITKVGAMLKEMRLQKGLKIADISKKLCIRKFYLEAIEDSNYNEIPIFPYGIGFIRSYANYLGLNGENIVELYKEETNSSEPKDMRVLEPQPEATMPGIQYLLISLLAIAIIYAGWMMFNQTEPETEEDLGIAAQTVAEPDNSGVVVVEEFNFEPPAEVESVAEEITPEPRPETEKQIIVSDDKYVEPQTEAPAKTEETTEAGIPATGAYVEVLKETWVEVKDDTKLYISKVLQAGDSYKVPEQKGMILSVGKPDGVKVYINGVLTTVARPGKKTNIALDKFLDANR